MNAYEHLAPAACKAVAALLPGTETTDDGGGPYITVDGEPVELFVLRPEDAVEPGEAWHWRYQHNGDPQVIATSELTITDHPDDVAAWARTILPTP